jgi:expansin (peptidoglycan-binding protein)
MKKRGGDRGARFLIWIMFSALAAPGCGDSGAAGDPENARSGGVAGADHKAAAGSAVGSAAEAGKPAAAGRAGSGSAGASSQSSGKPAATFGKKYEGGEFHLGPVDWDETQWHNACAPGTKYAKKIRQAEGDLLAGLWGGIDDVASYCDACIHVETAKGKSATLRVVTYGDTTPNSIDVSPEAFAILDSGEYPRAMTWQFAACPESGPVYYELQTGSSQWWTSLWVRNARLPLAKVEVKSANHDDWAELDRGTDGTLTDGGGFGEGPFSLRLTAIDGTEHIDEFSWPSGGIAGAMLEGKGNL